MHLRDGDAVPGWRQTPDAAYSSPAHVRLVALHDDYELKCRRSTDRDAERAPRERSHKFVNRVGMGGRQQGKPSLRGLQDVDRPPAPTNRPAGGG